MFGKNPLRSPDPSLTSLTVEETFFTIQGEGPFSGMPALFIRLSGCNLACTFCDTQFEEKIDQPIALQAYVNYLLGNFTKLQRRFVVITGGEPMRQQLAPLIEQLRAYGTELIQIETAGTYWQDGLMHYLLSKEVVLVCSPKTPKVNRTIADFCEHWKYVIKAGEVDLVDGLPNRGTQKPSDSVARLFRPGDRCRMTHHMNTIWTSPCDSYDEAVNRANLDQAVKSAMDHGYRLSLQVHKILGMR